jgi:hypothetical protein
MNDALGWVATTLFVSSYFFKRPALLRVAQMSGAALWIVYGVMIGAMPVIVANALVFAAAAWTMVGVKADATPPRGSLFR